MRRRAAHRTPLASLSFLLLALALSSLPAFAGGAQSSLAWDKCRIDGGAVLKLFSCDDDDAPEHVAVVSFVLEENLSGFESLAGSIYLMSAEGELPDWWQVWNPGTCREGSLALDVGFSSIPHAACENAWTGTTWGGVESFTPAYHGARLTFGFAPVTTRTLAAGRSYFAARLLVSNARTTGPDACAGCGTPFCLYVEWLDLRGTEGVRAELGADSGIGWNCGDPQGEYGCWHDTMCVTSARNRTWGMLKAFYR